MNKLPSLLGSKFDVPKPLSTRVGHSATQNYLSSLPTESQLKSALGDAYIINQPLNEVGGDGYWIENTGDKIFFVVFDCMGHGHLATIMTRIYVRLLNHVIFKREIHDPAEILTGLHERIKTQFKNLPNRQIGCGADIGVLVLNKFTGTMKYAGAKMDLVQIAGGELKRTKGHRWSVGRYFSYNRTYQTVDVPVWKNAKYYLYSDGITDLFGGPKNKKLGFHQFSNWLLETEDKKLMVEKSIIEKKIDRWIRKSIRFDDLLLVAFQI